ncbi:MAG: AAA family ATPase [Paludibacteraceae bacterium]|nr:AAA family ATPase [Paludibacteraceae bacterium]
MEFDEYQKKVIEAKDGHYLVLAPPGCGKTELLTHRVIAAHGEGVPYEKMLCLTNKSVIHPTASAVG